MYGFVSMILFPLLLIELNSKLTLPVYKATSTEFLGIAAILFGGFLLICSTRIFAVHGKGGSPLPFDPPKQLVTIGVYRYIRNPMFVASGLIWLGEFLFFGSILLFFYALAWILFNHVHLITQDEKWLEKRFGDGYKKYKQQVPRYFPKLKLFS